MALKGLSQFNTFALTDFLRGKRLLFVKASQWVDKKTEQATVQGSTVVVQIWEDNTVYSKPDISNFGEQLTIKVQDVAPSAFDKWKPLSTEVRITNVIRASVFGEYHNQLSIQASVSEQDAK